MRKAKKRCADCRTTIGKSVLFVIAALLFFGCGGQGNDVPQQGGGAKQPGRNEKADEIIAEFLKRDAAPYRKVRVRFTIISESDPPKVYELDTLRRQSEDQTATLTQIIKPLEDNDLASLTIESEGKPTVVTTYSESLKDFRETDTNKMFFGGLTAGELLGEWRKFDYKVIKEEQRDGRPYYEIEGKLKKDLTGVIARTEISMDGSDLVPRQLRLFDVSGRQIRTFTIKDVRSDSKGAFAAVTEADNPIYKTKVLIEVQNREFPERIDDAMFTKERLKQIATKQKPS